MYTAAAGKQVFFLPVAARVLVFWAGPKEAIVPLCRVLRALGLECQVNKRLQDLQGSLREEGNQASARHWCTRDKAFF